MATRNIPMGETPEQLIKRVDALGGVVTWMDGLSRSACEEIIALATVAKRSLQAPRPESSLSEIGAVLDVISRLTSFLMHDLAEQAEEVGYGWVDTPVEASS